MHSFCFQISVNGTMTQTTVLANNMVAAEKLMRAQYPNCTIVIYSRKQLN